MENEETINLFSGNGRNENTSLDIESKGNVDSSHQNTLKKYPVLIRPQPLTEHPQCRNPYPLTKRKGSRLLYNTGKYNVSRSNTSELWIAHFRDFSHTLVESPWKWILLTFTSCYVLSWLLFAWFYQLVATSNGDRDGNYTSEVPCFEGINSFIGYYLFSLETQHSIGFGTRSVSDNCMEAVFLLSMQVILGNAICGAMASLVYTKMVRPQSPPSRRLFANNAVICQRNGQLCLIFRVRDMEKRHQVGTKVNAFVIEKRHGIPFLRSITLETPGLLLWPVELVHKITPSSPLWNFSARDLITIRLEFMVTIEGTSINTGQTSTTKASYVSSEILWGHRFKPCVRYNTDLCCYEVNQQYFHDTDEVITPLCSAHRLQELYERLQGTHQNLLFENKRFSPTSSGIESLKEEERPNEEKKYFNEVLRKLSVISESKSRENVDNRESLYSNEKEGVDYTNNKDEIRRLEVELDKCLDDLNRNLSEIGSPSETRKSSNIEALISELSNYLDK